MFNFLRTARKGLRTAVGLLGLAGIAACDVNITPIGGAGGEKSDGTATEVALLLPYGSPTPGDERLAKALENAARLAAADLGAGSVNILSLIHI